MKSYKLALICTAILIPLLLGAFILNAQSAPKRIQAKAYWKPNTYHTDTPVPQPWVAWLHFTSKVSATDINASSVVLKGYNVPTDQFYPIAIYDLAGKGGGSWVVFAFNGYDVLTCALEAIGHMAPGTGHMTTLEISGTLNDGTGFDTYTSGTIVIFDPELPPP